MGDDRASVPLLMRMAAHPLRWALMSELAGGDRRVRELVAAVGEPQNLVSYHLRLLRSAGLVTARRSTFDGRDSYYHLDLARCGRAFAEAAGALHPALAPPAPPGPLGGSVLFLCTGNSARSPIAEALLRQRGGGRVEVASAGSHPKPALHPNTVRVMRERYDIDLGGKTTTAMASLADRRFDYVITLCDKVREVPRDHGSATTVHWSLPDPTAAGSSDDAGYAEFCRVAEEIETRNQFLLALLTTGSAENAHHD
ncbi:arsenate reductase/protein-tyrosine-phosphatase family protein [Actinokineospora fastidiosa]|uniref:ArsR family transcriptional regulator n=1 Tax=Actinokineospora fastidiosa TaxID=1816 RepID=A0A918GCG5_9PSEU|nr:ArsR family transcriptional regulator [Actinokineospora fastidiosa]GGS30017.1 ArsR family transcriptional regulator [Actinokineospora fastidiosa]